MKQKFTHAGLASYGSAAAFFKKRPSLYFLGLVPSLIAAAIASAVFALCIAVFYSLSGVIIGNFPVIHEWATLIQVVSTIAFGFLSLLVTFALFTDITFAIGDASGIYDKIWRASELSVNPSATVEMFETNLTNLQKINDESRSFLHTTITSLRVAFFVFLIGLVPVIGNIGGIVFGLLAMSLVMSEEYSRRTMLARNIRHRERINIVKKYREESYVYGVISQLLFMIPFLGVFLMPFVLMSSGYFARALVKLDAESNTPITLTNEVDNIPIKVTVAIETVTTAEASSDTETAAIKEEDNV